MKSLAPCLPPSSLLSVAHKLLPAALITSILATCSKLDAAALLPGSGQCLHSRQASLLFAPSAVCSTRHAPQRLQNSSCRLLHLASA